MKSNAFTMIVLIGVLTFNLLPTHGEAMSSSPTEIGSGQALVLSSAASGRYQDSEPTETGSRVSSAEVRTKGGLALKSADGDFAFALGGRVAVEAAFYQEDQNELGDGTALDAARLKMDGRVFRHWEYELSLTFEDGDTDILDANIAYNGWRTKITVGQFKEPFSLEEMTSSRYVTFMERGLPNVLTPGRSIGVGLSLAGDRWSAAGGIFGDDFNDDVADEGDESLGATARLTWAPHYDKTSLIHLGAAVSWRATGDDKVVSFDAKPESNITDIELVDTDDIEAVDTIARWGAELAVVRGPLSFQAEYIQIGLAIDGPADDLVFDGWYAYGSWVITGESRTYRRGKGVFGPIKPVQPFGAWEVALRYSVLNLTDAPVLGGEQEDWTLGINWYANRYVRCFFNAIWVQTDQDADGEGALLAEDSPVVYQARVQFDF